MTCGRVLSVQQCHGNIRSRRIWVTNVNLSPGWSVSEIPLLVVYGDHLDAPTYLPGDAPGWQSRFDECEHFISRLNSSGGRAEMLHPPRLGIHGNSHMIMQDRNNLQIADLIMNWIDRSSRDAAAR